MKPLIAAEATTFVLIQKVAKNQDKKILPPTGKTPRPALFVGPFPTFNQSSIKVFCLNSVFSFSLFPSVEQLRAKVGKTMVALSAMAGHSRFLQKRKGLSA